MCHTKRLQYPECFAFKYTVGVLISNRKDVDGRFYFSAFDDTRGNKRRLGKWNS